MWVSTGLWLLWNLVWSPLQGKIDPRVLQAKEPVEAIVLLQDHADLSSIPKEDRGTRLHFLQDFARRSQAPLLSWLQNQEGLDSLRPYWIINGFFLRGTHALIRRLAQRPEVRAILLNDTVRLHIARGPDPAGPPTPHTPEWGVAIIQADSVWTAYGLTGEGVVLANLDTGVDVNHPSLAGKFTGYWFDGVNGQSTPYDDHGHGTHTMGTMVGGDGPGPDPNDIGVAPGAMFAAAKGFNAGGSGQTSWILACYEFLASLVESVNLRIVSNSWGSTSTTSLAFWEATWNWRQLGIIPVFSIGNSGPGSGTAGTPGNFPTVIGVGATDAADNIASFSSRGPAPNQPPWNDPTYWPREDWNLIKPNIAAPGVNVRSSLPGGSFGTMSGTSMASPHVAGVIALMLEKNPLLDFSQVYTALVDHADHPPQGGSYPNNNYGWGRVNAFAAVTATPSPTDPYLRLLAFTFDDGGGNNWPDPGENVILYVPLRNMGAPALNVQGTLETNDPEITVTDPLCDYGDIPYQGTVQGDGFAFFTAPDRRPGKPATFVLTISGTDTTGEGFTLTDTLTFDIGTPQYQTWFTDDLSTLDRWQTGGTAAWGLTHQAHSPPNAATDSPNGTYGNNAHTYLLLRIPLNLSEAYHAQLLYWTRYDLEVGPYTGTPYDFGYVQAATDSSDGANWVTLKTVWGTQSAWVQDTVDLSPFAGQSVVYLRFLLESDGGVVRDGWFVDDVEIQLDYPQESVVLSYGGAEILDTLGNRNGLLDPGEMASLVLHLWNYGSDTAGPFTATLSALNPHLTVITPSTAVGTIPPFTSAEAGPFEVAVAPEARIAEPAPFRLILSGAQTDTLRFALTVSDSMYLPYGPDLYGYYAYEDGDADSLAPSFEWFEIGPGGPGQLVMEITNEDADTVTLPLPFPFRFYGQEFTRIGVCSNGFLELGGATYRFGGNGAIPSPSPPQNLIAPFWDDLDPSQGGDIYQYHDAAGHRWILEFYQVAHYENPNLRETFQVVLLDPAYYPTETGDGEILFLYAEVGDISSATVGIEAPGGQDGLQIAFNDRRAPETQPILSGRAIKLTTNRPTVAVGEGPKGRVPFALLPLTPNPVRHHAEVRFALPAAAQVTLALYDISGRLQRRLFQGRLSGGTHRLALNLTGLPSGLYFLRLEAQGRAQVQKLLLVR